MRLTLRPLARTTTAGVLGLTCLIVPMTVSADQTADIKDVRNIKTSKENREKLAEIEEIKQQQATPKTDVTAAAGKIDALIRAGYEKHGIEPNPPVSDEVFVRRIYLDIIGRTPTREEAEEFLKSDDKEKRSKLIDKLLSSEGYVGHFYNYWADILRINTALGNGSGPAEAAYNLWVKDSLRSNKPYDKFVYEMVTANGMIWENGAVGYYLRDRGMPLDNMSNTVRVFLGVRLECAQCHDHPFDKWTQLDYFKMAAFSHGQDTRRYETPNQRSFSTLQQQKLMGEVAEKVGLQGVDNETLWNAIRNKRTKKVEKLGLDRDKLNELRNEAREMMAANREEQRDLRRVISDLYNPIRYIAINGQERDLKLPHDYQYNDAKPFDVVEPETMFGAEVDPDDHGDLITAYGEWMVSPENPTFTKVIAGRLWKKVFGVGLTEPVDEITEHTEASNPELLVYLEELMRQGDYDMKGFLRILFNTQTYQREAFGGEIVPGVPFHFPGPALRRMTAEQIWDSMMAMMLPNSDYYMPGVKGRLESVERSRRIYEALEGRSPEEYAKMVDEVAQSIDGVYEKQQELRDEYVAAREAKDEEKIRHYQRELRALTQETRAAISEIAYTHPAGEDVDGSELLASAGMMEMAMMSGGDDAAAVVTSRPKVTMPDTPEGLTKDQARNWKKKMSYESSAYSKAVSRMMRSSELPSPAPRGHFLREFGQSDREVIENASNEASVPQALALLNGTTTELITNRFAVFGSDLAEAESADDAIDRIYMTMLSRPATGAEKSMLREKFDTAPNAAEQIVWALLNTQQFLFIQ